MQLHRNELFDWSEYLRSVIVTMESLYLQRRNMSIRKTEIFYATRALWSITVNSRDSLLFCSDNSTRANDKNLFRKNSSPNNSLLIEIRFLKRVSKTITNHTKPCFAQNAATHFVIFIWSFNSVWLKMKAEWKKSLENFVCNESITNSARYSWLHFFLAAIDICVEWKRFECVLVQSIEVQWS